LLRGRSRGESPRIEVAQDEDGIWQLFGRIKFCTGGRDSFAAGTCDSKIAVVDGSRTSIFWTMGSPIHWQGAWDRYEFD
jgi:hypothetical protein